MDGMDLRRLYTAWLDGGRDKTEVYTAWIYDRPDNMGVYTVWIYDRHGWDSISGHYGRNGAPTRQDEDTRHFQKRRHTKFEH